MNTCLNIFHSGPESFVVFKFRRRSEAQDEFRENNKRSCLRIAEVYLLLKQLYI